MPSNPITGAPLPDPGLPAALRDLAAVLVPGTVISGRILEALGDDKYAVQLRGRTLVAESSQPLIRGEVVRVQVDSVGDQIHARLMADDGGTQIPVGRLQALGLPGTPAGMLVLSAFERLGAPLQPDRLQVAVAQVAEALARPLPASQSAVAGGPPPPTPEHLADAFALLARANLPATAPLVGLALKAVPGELPNTAAALVDLRQVAEETGVTRNLTAPGTGPSTPVNPSPPVSQGMVSVPPPIGGAAGSPPDTARPGLESTGATTPVPATGSAPVPPSAGSAGLAAGAPQVAVPAPPPVTGVPATVAETSQTPIAASSTSAPSSPVTTIPVMPAGSATPVAVAMDGAPAPVANAESPPASRSGVVPAASPVVSDAVNWRAVLADPLPDADRDGAAGVMRALVLAGVRSRLELADDKPASVPVPTTPGPSGEAEAKDPPSPPIAPLVRHLITLMAGEVASPAHHQDGAQPPVVSAPVAEAAVRVAHEQAAQTVFPPDHLADYDRVLGLPLMANGQPVPARVAVSSRNAPGGGTATFLRVDAELSRLGPVSIRLSGIDGGAMAITLMAGDTAARELAATLPDLAADLRRLGLTAGLRVVGDDGSEQAAAVSHDG